MARGRLFGRIDATVGSPLLWIQGPAGAGKSTLVSSYLRRDDTPSLWYRVDGSDVDAATVCSHLAEGASGSAGRRRVALPVLTIGHLPVDLPGFMRRFFRALFAGLPPRAALVFDGLDGATEGILTELLPMAADELLPEQRLVVTSRQVPPARLAPMIPQGRMAVIDWEELRVSLAEADAIAGGHGAVDSATLQRIVELSEGWMAGFVVLLARVQRAGELGQLPAGPPGTELFAYFLQEMFARIETGIQAILLRTALLPSFTGEQAAQMVPGANVAGVLDWLVRRHFFIERSEGAPAIHRYHRLFREFLLRVGRERIAPEERERLLRVAAGLLRAGGDDEDGLALLIEARAWPDAVRLVCGLAPRLLAQGRSTVLQRYAAALPPASIDAEPWLRYWQGIARLQGEPQRARAELAAACRRFEHDGHGAGALQACAAILESLFVEWGDLHPLDDWAVVFERCLGRDDADANPDAALLAVSRASPLVLRLHRHAGLVAAARRRVLALAARAQSPASRMVAANFQGLMHHVHGEWGAGLQHVADTERWLDQASIQPIQRLGWQVVKARLLVWGGDFPAAWQLLAQAEALAERESLSVLVPLMASAGVYAGLNGGDLPRAQAALDRLRSTSAATRTLDGAQQLHHAGMMALARGQTEPARQQLQAALDIALRCGAELLAATYRIVLAQALGSLGRLADAAAEIRQVETFARAAGLPVLEQAALTVDAWLAHLGRAPDVVARVRAAFTLGREGGHVVIYPWVSDRLLHDLVPVGWREGIETRYIAEVVRLRGLRPPDAGSADWPWRIRILTLGRFELLVDGVALETPSKAPRRPLDLLKALLAADTHGQGVSLSVLESLLWPDLDGDAARNACSVALYRLRRLLQDEQALAVHDGRLRLDPGHAWADHSALVRLCDEPVENARATLERLLAIYRGDFLADDEASWAIPQRERLRGRLVRRVTQLVPMLVDDGQPGAAIDLLERLVEVLPTAEALHLELMRLLLALGREADALAAYQRYRTLLRHLTGAAPSPQAERLYRTIFGGPGT